METKDPSWADMTTGEEMKEESSLFIKQEVANL
jgi:hypothetical protein